MHLMAFLSTSLLAVFLAACATTPPLATPSGKPEVTINTTDRALIKGLLINELMNAGFGVDQESDNSISASREMTGTEGVMYQTLMGNVYSSTPRLTIRVNMAPVSNQTRVMAQIFARIQNAYGREDVQDVTSGKKAQDLMSFLTKVKQKAEGTYDDWYGKRAQQLIAAVVDSVKQRAEARTK